jgi:hypothetical protein
MLAPWIFVNFLYSPLSNLIYVFEKQHANLIFSITLITGRIGALLLGACVINESRSTVLFYGMVNLLMYLSISGYLLRCARVSLREMIGDGLETLLLALPFLAVVAACKWVFGFPGIVLLTVAILVSLLYLIIVISRNRELQNILLEVFRRKRTEKKAI